MHSGPVVWDEANRQHLISDHPERALTEEEVTEAMRDNSRLEGFDVKRGSHTVLGRGALGRVLFVAWVERDGGRYPVHARVASKRLEQRYTR